MHYPVLMSCELPSQGEMYTYTSWIYKCILIFVHMYHAYIGIHTDIYRIYEYTTLYLKIDQFLIFSFIVMITSYKA